MIARFGLDYKPLTMLWSWENDVLGHFGDVFNIFVVNIRGGKRLVLVPTQLLWISLMYSLAMCPLNSIWVEHLSNLLHTLTNFVRYELSNDCIILVCSILQSCIFTKKTCFASRHSHFVLVILLNTSTQVCLRISWNRVLHLFCFLFFLYIYITKKTFCTGVGVVECLMVTTTSRWSVLSSSSDVYGI